MEYLKSEDIYRKEYLYKKSILSQINERGTSFCKEIPLLVVLIVLLARTMLSAFLLQLYLVKSGFVAHRMHPFVR